MTLSFLSMLWGDKMSINLQFLQMQFKYALCRFLWEEKTHNKYLLENTKLRVREQAYWPCLRHWIYRSNVFRFASHQEFIKNITIFSTLGQVRQHHSMSLALKNNPGLLFPPFVSLFLYFLLFLKQSYFQGCMYLYHI